VLRIRLILTGFVYDFLKRPDPNQPKQYCGSVLLDIFVAYLRYVLKSLFMNRKAKQHWFPRYLLTPKKLRESITCQYQNPYPGPAHDVQIWIRILPDRFGIDQMECSLEKPRLTALKTNR
jgi:hypothetical protein